MKKRALFRNLIERRKKDAPDSASLALERVPRDGPLPLSHMQERIWLADQLEGGAAYHMPLEFALRGPLDHQALEKTFDEIVRRHEVLRTTIRTGDGGRPVQEVQPWSPVKLLFVDLRDLTPGARALATERICLEAARLPFDLSRGHPLRVSLLRLDRLMHLLQITSHHIVTDAWSHQVLWREMSTLYEAYLERGPSPLPALPFQYGDYAHWQRTRRSEETDRQVAFWQKKLEGLTILELPLDHPRPSVPSRAGGVVKTVLSAEVVDRLQTLSQNEGVTFFMTMLSALKVLLHRYSDQEDICVGSPHAKRDLGEVADLLGVFIGMMALRTDLSGKPPFTELMRRVKETCLDAYSNSELLFERLRGMPRVGGQMQLFNVNFILQNQPNRCPLALKDLEVELEPRPEYNWVHDDLEIYVVPLVSGLELHVRYSTDLFDPLTIERLAAHFEHLLNEIVRDPGRSISELPLLPGSERRQVLELWNDTTVEYAADSTLHALLETQAVRTPDAVAVLFGEEELTYEELNRRSNMLAYHLRARGVGPDVVVGVCMERSAAMMVALCGVLKAGGAYLPLDPEFPRARIAYMLEDSGAPIVVTEENLALDLDGARCRRLDLDASWGEICQGPADVLEGAVSSENLAYVIYTSGSTGRPKGVSVRHRAVVNFREAICREPGLAPSDVLVAVTTISFDISVLELFLPLTVGARVVLASREQAVDGQELSALLSRSAATAMQATPATWWILHAAGWKGRPGFKALCGGEAMSAELAKVMLSWSDSVWNLYGPTETTVWSAVHRVTDRDGAEGTVLIGGPLSNTRIYILDRELQPVPPGVRGELYIAGDGLARGYWNRPGLTAERFIPDPHAGTPGSLMYHTGDLARFRRDGIIEFLGRADHQVKVRGFRIELGEIEARLGELEDVGQAVVLVREDHPGDVRLVAYIVPAAEAAPPVESLRAHLAEGLPYYMVPSAFVTLDELPLTPNRKVNRKELPAPEGARPDLDEAYEPPASAVELALSEIWATVLGVDQVGVHDNFFELGGHSLLLARVRALVNDRIGIDLPLVTFFQNPSMTIAGLAEVVGALIDKTADGARAGGTSRREMDRFELADRSASLRPSFSQEWLWFLDQLEGSAAYHLQTRRWLNGALDIEALERAFSEVVLRHEVLRTTLEGLDGAPMQVVHPPARFPVPLADLSCLPPDAGIPEGERLAVLEPRRPFDLASGPVLRSLLVRLNSVKHLLIVTLHHIAGDGWSMELLNREVATLYNAFVSARPPSLPELPVQYVDYAAWQRRWLTEEELDNRLAYWRERLDGTRPLELPVDRLRPPRKSHRGASLNVDLPKALVERLEALSRREGATLFMTLLAGFKLVLSRHAGQPDVAVGSPVADRNRPELEGLIGFFINTVVIRTDLSDDLSFRELLGRVREASLGAHAHSELPFEKLVSELRFERDLSRSPAFQVQFAFQSYAGSQLSLHGIEMEPLAGASVVAQQDLDVYAWPGSDSVHLTVMYCSDLFERSTISRMFEHYRNVLERAVDDPDRTLSAFALTSEEEERQLLSWGGSDNDGGVAGSFLELLAARVTETPEAPALLACDRSLNFRELARAAEDLASALSARGAAPGAAVGICIDLSAELPVCVLAALYAGMPFVLLDPDLDDQELGEMIDRGGVGLLLTGDGAREELASDRGIPMMTADSKGDGVDSIGRGAPPEEPAWISFTAGPEAPRAVTVTHGVVASQLRAMKELAFAPGPTDVSLLSVPWDTSHLIWSLLGPLVSGTPVAIDGEPWSDGAAQPVTWRFVSPYLLRELLVDGEGVGTLEKGGVIVVTGEALAPGLARRVRAWAPRTKLLHAYSMAEAGVVAIEEVLEIDEGVRVPVGTPVPGTRVHVLDRRLALAPVGVVGEIYVSSAGANRSNAGAPARDAAAFLPDPFRDAGGRLMRTGDLGRYLADGRLELWGPQDRRVRIRGFEVDLDILEGCICEIAGTTHAAVVEQEGLVAHLVSSDDEHPPDEATVRDALREKLPGYMLPGRVERWDDLPLTWNGRIARRELAESEPEWRVVVSATFTAEPLQEPLEYWFDRVDVEGEIIFAPYNQVFQQLLDPGSESGQNARGANVVLVRPEDWLRYLDPETGGAAEHLERTADDLIEALSRAAARSAVPYVVVECPAEDGHLATLRQSLLARLERLGGIHVVPADEVDALYPVSERFDVDSEEMGHIPFSSNYFAALASMVMRKMYATMHSPKKVVVLDCDNTLWTGVVGEDGVLGVRVDETRAALQRFMIDQQERGRLLCLCSKNEEADVLDVFDRHPDMVLKREHLVSWRINWSRKSENIQELAAELGLGLDSFIFVDDSPVECAEVEAATPEVEAVLLPTDVEEVPTLLKHVWSFDVLKTTAEDRKRTRMYQQQVQRAQLRKTQTLDEFIERLELKIEIGEMEEADLPRASQLTLRTNQFNMTAIRRKEADLRQILSGEHECLVARVSDRFGDYGLVGAMIFRTLDTTLEVDTFLLSCRVLDRGVEHAMVERLGEVAHARGLEAIRLHHVRTDRNLPAQKFLDYIARRGGNSGPDGVLVAVADAKIAPTKAGR